MIKAELFVKDRKIVGFHLTGHSGMEEYGKDVLCAFVSSAAYMTANTITDIINADAQASADDGDMYLMVSDKHADRCSDILSGFRLHLINTQEQYPKYLKVIFTEV